MAACGQSAQESISSDRMHDEHRLSTGHHFMDVPR
jgi:hypothetical protein